MAIDWTQRQSVEQLIARHEGLRRYVYCDKCGNLISKSERSWYCYCTENGQSPGNLTIGYGRNLSAVGITELEADALLHNDVTVAIAELLKYPWFEGLSPARRAALTDMMFNLGAEKFDGFEHMVAALYQGRFESAAAAMLDSAAARELPERYAELAKMMREG